MKNTPTFEAKSITQYRNKKTGAIYKTREEWTELKNT
jgi:hypothetical protein